MPYWIACLLALAACEGAEDRSTSWSYLYPAIIRPTCTSSQCHAERTAQDHVDLSTKERACDVLLRENYVQAGAPESSQLIYMLRGTSIARMPPDMPLPDVEIEQLSTWILEGAPCE